MAFANWSFPLGVVTSGNFVAKSCRSYRISLDQTLYTTALSNRSSRFYISIPPRVTLFWHNLFKQLLKVYSLNFAILYGGYKGSLYRLVYRFEVSFRVVEKLRDSREFRR